MRRSLKESPHDQCHPSSLTLITVTVIVTVMAGGVSSSIAADLQQGRPIRILTSAAGGGADFLSRIVSQRASGPLGMSVVVDNRPGVVSAEVASKAAADGHTLLFQSNVLWLSPFLQKVSYDPVRDFAPITLAAVGPNVLVVHPSLPVGSLRELTALAKAKPGQLNYSSAGSGAPPHLGMEMYKAMAGVSITRVAYKGTAPALSAVLSGEVHMMLANTAQVAPQVKAGRLKALAISSAEPTALFPGLPTMAASGLDGYEAVTSYGVFAPARIPVEILRRLHVEIVRSLQAQPAREQLANAGLDLVAGTPEKLTATVAMEMATAGRFIREAGIRAE